MNQILVTGGAGYIGSVLVENLLSLGHSVKVVDDFRYTENSLNHLFHYKNLSVIKSDVCDFENYKADFKDSDVIIPLAALVGAPIVSKNSEAAKAINVNAVKRLFSESSSDQFFIMPTTNSAYGKGNENGYCDETTVLNPISQYAIDKVQIEKSLLQETNGVSLRLATVFGVSPRMRTDLLVNDFVLRASRDGVITLFEPEFRRNYVHVRDVSNAIVFMLENRETVAREIFNVGLTSANMSKRQLCNEIKKFIPSLQVVEVPLAKDPDQRDYLVSNSKIEKIGFSCLHSLGAGIEELIKFYSVTKKNIYGNI